MENSKKRSGIEFKAMWKSILMFYCISIPFPLAIAMFFDWQIILYTLAGCGLISVALITFCVSDIYRRQIVGNDAIAAAEKVEEQGHDPMTIND